MIKITPKPRRRDLIISLSKAKETVSHPITFQNRRHNLPIHRVSIDFPIYRLLNGRTMASQEQYKSIKKKKDSFFQDPENIEAQEAQHSILKEMIDKEGLREYFKNIKQQEPLILDVDGLVINGNRRLCAWRELLSIDSKKYSHFSHLDVVILPVCTAEDIIRLEAELQVQKDIKADYSWIDQAFMIRNSRNTFQLDDKRLVEIYGMSSEKELKDSISSLDYVDLYLDSRGKTKHYSMLERSEYAFREIMKYQQKIKSPQHKEIFIQSVFSIIDLSLTGSKTGRIYQDIGAIYASIKDIETELQKTFPSKSAKVKANPLDKKASITHATILDVEDLKTNKGIKVLQSITKDAIETYLEKKKVKEKKSLTLNNLQKAQSLIDEAIGGLGHTKEKDAVKKHYDAIIKSLEAIKKWLK